MLQVVQDTDGTELKRAWVSSNIALWAPPALFHSLFLLRSGTFKQKGPLQQNYF